MSSDSLRVLQILPSLGRGGTERLVIEIVRRLENVESIVCCLDDEGSWAKEVTRLGVPVVALERQPGFRPSLSRSIARLIAKHGVQVIHCHHYSPFVYGRIAALLRPGVRVVFTEHGRLSDAPPSRKRRLVNPMLGRLSAQIFAVSADLRLHMIAEGFPADRVRVIHNGIDPGPPSTAAARSAARRALNLPGDAFIVGTVARLDPVKDLATLIRAFARLRAQRPSARLVIVGDGPERQALELEIARHGLGGAATFTGHREDARRLVSGFDVFANSSIHEGVSLTILEAMAAGLPVVATRVGGNPEVVDDRTGILVPARSADDFGAALEWLAADTEGRRSMGGAARARLESAFSIQRMVGAYAACYRQSAPVSRPGHFSLRRSSTSL
jgi:glycosyltransferase involved in cell wall biosynthesis